MTSSLFTPSLSVANVFTSYNPDLPHDAVTDDEGPEVVMLQFWSVASGYQDIRRLSLSLRVSSASISRVATMSSSIVHVPSSAGRYGMPSIENLISPGVGATFRTSYVRNAEVDSLSSSLTTTSIS